MLMNEYLQQMSIERTPLLHIVTRFSNVFVPLCEEFNEYIKHHHFRVLLVYHIHLESERTSALASQSNLAHVACPKMSFL